MTKEELKEAIAATITENGQKGITGHALANLLNEIVDAAGEGGNSDIFVLDLPIDIDGNAIPSEKNAKIRQKLIDGISTMKFYPVFLGLPYLPDENGNVATGLTVKITIYGFLDESRSDFVLLSTDLGGELAIVLNEDGSLSEYAPESEV